MSPEELPQLLQRHAGLIAKVAHAWCKDATDRDDVMQEIALQLWRSAHRYDPNFRESTFVWRIALNVAISFHRRERRHRRARQPVDDPAVTPTARDDHPPENVQRLHACIAGLPALDRALVLLWLDGNDHATTAEVLGISATNVSTRFQRLKERLAIAFARRPATPP